MLNYAFLMCDLRIACTLGPCGMGGHERKGSIFATSFFTVVSDLSNGRADRMLEGYGVYRNTDAVQRLPRQGT